MLNLASFLGEQLRNLHLLPYPPFDDLTLSGFKQKMELTNGCMEYFLSKSNIPVEWEFFIRTLTEKKKDVASRLTNWYEDTSFAFYVLLTPSSLFNIPTANCIWFLAD